MYNDKILVKKFNDHEVLQTIISDMKFSSYNSPELVGGAVLDIIEDKVPKDYDFVKALGQLDILIDNGWKFISETKTAITLIKNLVIVQLLKTNKANFEYKISQSTYKLYAKQLLYDKISFDTKTLIPTTFDNKKIALECLFRLPKYKNKGYTINDVTYLSLLNVINRTTYKQTDS